MSNVLDDVARAGFMLSKGFDVKEFIASLVDQLFDITASHLVCFFSLSETEIRLFYRRGKYRIGKAFSPNEEPFQFVVESKETVVLTERKKSPFLPLLLHESMHSGVITPLGTRDKVHGFIVLNALEKKFFVRNKLRFIEVITRLAGEYFHNSLLHNRLKEYTRKIEMLERYHQNIFSSMRNLLLTTDTEGNLNYFNRSASRRFSLTEKDLGRSIMDIFSNKIAQTLLDHLWNSVKRGEEILGAEGTYRGKREINFSLNTSPLVSEGGKREGLTLIFTDQGREGELKEQVRKTKGKS